MKRVLVTENVAQAGLDLLQQTLDVSVHLNPSRSELLDIIPGYEALVVRSATRVDADVLVAGSRLVVVGRAGTGVDNVDLDAATRQGVVVVNAPGSNTVAVAEHTIGLMLCMARHLAEANVSTRSGRWEKSALMGSEVRGKTLGLVGLGKVGSAVASRARGLEMQVVAHDPFVAPERAAQLDITMVSLDELLFRSDYISLHAPLTQRTRGLVSARELALMKPSARLINCARGELIVEADLIGALRDGVIAGAALDVFADEPHISQGYRECPNLLLTPHLGASTEEAQSEAALEVARQIVDVLEGRPPQHPVNLPVLSSEEARFLAPYEDLSRRLGRFYAQLSHNNLQHLEITYAGELISHDVEPLSAAVLSGVLQDISDIPVNPVNARLIAQDRGLVVTEARTSAESEYAGMVTLRACTTSGERTVAGSVVRGRPHIMRIDDYWFDFAADGWLLVSEHLEQLGVIGQMGTLLGESGVSLSFVQVARQSRGGHGMMVLGLDDQLSEEALAKVAAMPSVCSVWRIDL